MVLNDEEVDAPARVDLADGVGAWKMSRRQLARVLAEALGRDDWLGRTVSVSG